MDQPDYSDTTRYRINAAGSIVSIETGRIVANPGGGKNAITPARSRELYTLRRARQERDRLVGLARSMGVNPSDVDDELLEQAGSAIAALTEHMARTFMQSSNLRGMGETYSRLLGLDDDRQTPQEGGQVGALTALLAQIRGLIGDRQVVDGVVTNGSVVDGNASANTADNTGGSGGGSG